MAHDSREEKKVCEPTVIVTRELPDVIEAKMKLLFQVQFNERNKPLTSEEMIATLKTANILVTNIGDYLSRDLLQQAGSQLKLITNYGTGVDNIDLPAAAEQGIAVTHASDVLTEDTADVAMTMVLSVLRGLHIAYSLVQENLWLNLSPCYTLGKRLCGKKLGILGMGRIGKALARRARAFGLSIHYHNRHPVRLDIEEELEATYWPTLESMLPHVDVFSINCPLTPATYHLLSAQKLKYLRSDSSLVNTSRGDIIDESALCYMLENNLLACAALDVFANEPLISSKLFALAQAKKAIILPHVGSASLEGRIEAGEKVIKNISAFLKGQALPDQVFFEQL